MLIIQTALIIGTIYITSNTSSMLFIIVNFQPITVAGTTQIQIRILP